MYRSIPLAALILLTGTFRATAGTVTLDTVGLDEGNVSALLEATSQRYVDAMHNLIAQHYREDYRAIRWEALESSMSEARLARLEYRYMSNGFSKVRIYHAMGGDPLGQVAKSAFDGPTPATTPVSVDFDAGWEDEEATPSGSRTFEDTIAGDAEDEALFSGFDDIDVRARILPFESSALRPFPVPGQQDALDAEMKALRYIEQDIADGVIPAGGRIEGFLDGMTCSSCRLGMRTLADKHGLDIRMSQLYRTLPSEEESALVAAGRARLRAGILVDTHSGRPLVARDVLMAARKAQIQNRLSPRTINRSTSGMLWRQRSFRLASPRLPDPSAGQEGRSPYVRNPDVEEPPPPEC